MAFVVLLDASVLVPAALRDVLLRAAEAYLYRPIWSEAILREVEQSLVEDLGKSDEQVAYLLNEVRRAFPDAAVEGYEALIPVMTVHEKDRHVAAAAVVGRGQGIVTLNLRHFPQAALDPYNIEAQSPDDFLESLADLDEEKMVEILTVQASVLTNPPHTALEVCCHLSIGAPRFADRMKRLLEAE